MHEEAHHLQAPVPEPSPIRRSSLAGVAGTGATVVQPHGAHARGAWPPFYQVISRRYERGAMLVTSNRSMAERDEVLVDAVVATPILDLLLHHSHVITIRVDSCRLRTKRLACLFN